MLAHFGFSASFKGTHASKAGVESPAEIVIAGAKTVISEPFSPTGTTGQLQIGGLNVSSGASITALRRTDWRGTFTLAATSRTNLETNSNNWNIVGAAGWTYNNCSVVSGKSDPSGGTGAFRIIPDTVNTSYHGPERSTAVGGATTLTTTIYARAAGYNYIRFADWADSSFDSRVSLIDGTVYNGAGVTTTALYVGDGWWKITATGTNTTGRRIVVFVMADSIQTSFAGDGVLGVDVFHCQTETGSTATALITNSTGAVRTVTDYSVTAAGVVTLGESATGVYTWTGAGVTASGLNPSFTGTPALVASTAPTANIFLVAVGTAAATASSSATLNVALSATGTPGALAAPAPVVALALTVAGTAAATAATAPVVALALAPTVAAGAVAAPGSVVAHSLIGAVAATAGPAAVVQMSVSAAASAGAQASTSPVIAMALVATGTPGAVVSVMSSLNLVAVGSTGAVASTAPTINVALSVQGSASVVADSAATTTKLLNATAAASATSAPAAVSSMSLVPSSALSSLLAAATALFSLAKVHIGDAPSVASAAATFSATGAQNLSATGDVRLVGSPTATATLALNQTGQSSVSVAPQATTWADRVATTAAGATVSTSPTVTKGLSATGSPAALVSTQSTAAKTFVVNGSCGASASTVSTFSGSNTYAVDPDFYITAGARVWGAAPVARVVLVVPYNQRVLAVRPQPRVSSITKSARKWNGVAYA